MISGRPDPRSLGTFQRLRMLGSDTIVYGIASAINRSFALLLFPFLSRNLSVADYGRLDFALYAAVLFALVSVWGQDAAVARLFFEGDQKEDRQQIISQAFLIMGCNLVLSISTIVAIWQTSLPTRFFGPYALHMMVLMAIHAPLSGLLSFCQSVLKWTFDRNRYLIIALGLPAINLAAILLFSRFDNFGPVMALGIMVGVGGGFAALALVMIRKWLVWPQGTAFVYKLLPLALPYGVISAMGWITPVVERAVVSGRFGPEDLGLYAAAAKIASIASILAIAFQMGWGPFSYAIYKQADAARTYNLVLRAFSAVICIAVLCLSAAAEPVTTLLAGDRYRAAAFFVFPIAMAFGIQAIGWISELGIHLSKKTYLNLIGFACFVAISLGSIFYLSRTLGMIGVPLGALAGQLAMLIVSAAVAQRVYPIAWRYGLPTCTIALTLLSGTAALILPSILPGLKPLWFYVGGAGIVTAINLIFFLSGDERRRLMDLAQAMGRQASRPDR